MSFTTTPQGFAENAPKAEQAFHLANDPDRQAFIAKRQAEQAQRHERTQDQQEILPTKAELDQRVAQRAIPNPALELTPDGPLRQTVKSNIDSKNEERIRFIEQRFNALRNAPKRDFARSQ